MAGVVPVALWGHDTDPPSSPWRPPTAVYRGHSQRASCRLQHGICETEASQTHHSAQTHVSFVPPHNIIHNIS